MVVEVDKSDPTCGGMKAIFIDANGLWLELILPTSPGPGMEILKKRGPGSIIEANFEGVEGDYLKTLEIMENNGIQMLAMDGSPLLNAGRIDEGVQGIDGTKEEGQCIAYWPADLTGGTTIEIYELKRNDEHSLLNIRDKQWKNEKPNPRSPRIHHIVAAVKDIEKAASFYTDVLGLERSSENIRISSEDNRNVGSMELAFINTGNEKVWMELCQPKGPGPVAELMEKQGEGAMIELAIEVDDIGEYYDQLQAKGVELVDTNGTPFPTDSKCQVLKPFGDKIAYIPKDVACGMNIEVIERGPRETSILHRLYD